MSIDQFIQAQRKKLKELINENKPLAIAATSTHTLQVDRIFGKGEGIAGKIGNYNTTKPLYVNPDDSPKSFPTKGKPKKDKEGQSVFQSGKKHKTGFFTSYSAFRKAIGRQTNFIDLKLTNLLFSDYANSLRKVNPFRWVSGLKNAANFDKLDGLKKRFGPITDLSKNEKESFFNILEKELAKSLQ